MTKSLKIPDHINRPDKTIYQNGKLYGPSPFGIYELNDTIENFFYDNIHKKYDMNDDQWKYFIESKLIEPNFYINIYNDSDGKNDLINFLKDLPLNIDKLFEIAKESVKDYKLYSQNKYDNNIFVKSYQKKVLKQSDIKDKTKIQLNKPIILSDNHQTLDINQIPKNISVQAGSGIF